ncbi:MAG: hypothetical protein IT426_05740 [Pirellulales bacterium]|nr:hypothetical protein [Pirellulales bacterium]
MLSKIYEVVEEIVVPWHRDLKEKRDLLREDPFVGFIAMSVLGAAFYFFTRQSPSWSGFFLHYAGIAMFLLGGIAALAAGWFGWGLYRFAAWPATLLALSIYGCFDTYQVSATSERRQASSFRGETGATLLVTRTDLVKRFTGRPLHRSEDSIDQVAGRTVRRSIAEGPLNAAGQKHGRWDVSSYVPKRNAPIVKWYWQDKEVTKAEWEKGGG